MAGTCKEYAFSFLPVVSRWAICFDRTKLIIHFYTPQVMYMIEVKWEFIIWKRDHHRPKPIYLVQQRKLTESWEFYVYPFTNKIYLFNIGGDCASVCHEIRHLAYMVHIELPIQLELVIQCVYTKVKTGIP